MKRSRYRRTGRVTAVLLAVLMAVSGFGGVWAAEGTGVSGDDGTVTAGGGLLPDTIEEGASYRADLSSVLGGGYEEAAFTYAGDVQGYTYGSKEEAAAGQGAEGTRTLLVSEQVYTGMSWNELNEKGLIYGDYSQPLALDVDGVVYDGVIRSLSGGRSAEYRAQDGLEQGETEANKHGLPEGNEWDAVVDKSVAADEANGTKNLKGWIKNWDSLASFTQDIHEKSGNVVVRGMAARGWNRCDEDYTMATYGFRPVLEIIGYSEAAEGIPLISADSVESGEPGDQEPEVSGAVEYVAEGTNISKEYKDGDIIYISKSDYTSATTEVVFEGSGFTISKSSPGGSVPYIQVRVIDAKKGQVYLYTWYNFSKVDKCTIGESVSAGSTTLKIVKADVYYSAYEHYCKVGMELTLNCHNGAGVLEISRSHASPIKLGKVTWGSAVKSVELGRFAFAIGTNASPDFKSIDLSKVTKYGNNALYGLENSGITNLQVQLNAYATLNKEYGEAAFQQCGLTEIPPAIKEGMRDGAFKDIPVKLFADNKISGVIEIKTGIIGNNAFADNPGITGVVLGDGVTRVSGFSNTSVAAVTLPSSTKIIGAAAFYGTKLSEISIPEGLEEIQNGAFANTQIRSLDLSHTNLRKFGGYTNYSEFGTSTGVIAGAPMGENVQLPDSVEEIGERAFEKASVACNFPKSLRKIGAYAFQANTAILGENGVLKLPANVEKIDSAAFDNCKGLVQVIIPNRITTLQPWSFQDCSNLTSVVFPQGLKCIASYVFSGCTSLQNVELPEGLTQLDGFAFKGCTSLGSIYLPSTFITGYNTTSPDSAPFRNCGSNVDIYIHTNSIKNGTNITRAKLLGSATETGPTYANLHTYYNVEYDLNGGVTEMGATTAAGFRVTADWGNSDLAPLSPDPTPSAITSGAGLAAEQPDGREFGVWQMTRAANGDRTYKVLWKEPLTGKVSIKESGGLLSADVSKVRPYAAWEGIDKPNKYFFSFEWYRNGEKIEDGEIPSYQLQKWDAGSEFTVKLIGKEDGPYAGSELISDSYTATTTAGQPYMRLPKLDADQTVLRWVAPEGDAALTGYRVYVSTTDPEAQSSYISGFNGKWLSPDTTRIQLNGATAGTTYYARVEAANAMGTTSSNVVSFTVKEKVDAETPEVRVENTEIQADCNMEYELSLDQLPLEDGGALSYRWYCKLDDGDKKTPFNEVVNGNTKDITIPAEQLSEVGTKYIYYCEVTNTNEATGISGETSAMARTPEITVTVVRGNPAAADVKVEKLVGGLQVSWNEVREHGEPVTAYHLYVSRQADMAQEAMVKGYGPKVVPADRAEDGTFSYTIDYMDTDQTYWIQVEAVTDRMSLKSVSEIVSSIPAVGDPVTFLLDQPEAQLGSVRLTSMKGSALDPQDVTKNMYVKLTAEPAAGYKFVEWRQKPLEDPEAPEPVKNGDLISGSFEQGDLTAKRTENPMILLIESDCRWEAVFAPITEVAEDAPRLNGLVVRTPKDRPLICEDGSLEFSEEKLHYAVLFTSQEEPQLELELTQFSPDIQVFVGDSTTPVAIDYSAGSKNTAVISSAALGIEMIDGAEIPLRMKRGESETIYKVTVDILEEAEDPAVVVELETRMGAKHADLALKVENLQFSTLNVAFRLPKKGLTITDTGYTPITGSGLEASRANYYGLFKGVELQTLNITEDEWGSLVQVSLRSADNKVIVVDGAGASLIKFYANQDEALAEKTVDEILAEAIEVDENDGGNATVGDVRFSTGESGLSLAIHRGLLQKRKAEMHDVSFVVKTMEKVIPGVRWTAEDLNRDDDKQLRTDPDGEVLRGRAVRFSGVASNYRFTVAANGYLKGIVTAPDVRKFTTLPQLTLLAGDLNEDGIINMTDLTLLIQSLNQTVEPGSFLELADTVIYPDFNWDGRIDALDEAALLSNYDKRNK